MAQEPGWLDIAYNSTFGVPQQILWRLYRILEDENISLFDEAGLMDKSLIPLLGAMDDDRHDVMPDYMAKQLGFADNAGGHIGAAILTDPLTFMSGGLTALGKAGKAANNASKLTAASPVIGRASAKSGKTFSKYVEDLQPGELLAHLDEAIKLAPNAKAAKQLTKHANRLRKTLPGAVEMSKGKPLTIKKLFKHQSDRQIALGLVPFGIGKWGKRAVGPGYSSWLKYIADATRGRAGFTKQALQTDVGKASHMFVRQKLLDIPGVRSTLSEVSAPFRQFVGGLKVGGEVLADVKAANVARTDIERHKLSRLYASQATDIVQDLHKSFETHGPSVINTTGKKGKASLIALKYDDLIKEGKTHEEAFLGALQSYGIRTKGESAASIWGRLTGQGPGLEKFPAWGAGSSKGIKQIDGNLAKAVAEHAEASAFLRSGITDVPGSTALGDMAAALRGDREKLSLIGQGISEAAFATGKMLRAKQTELFKTGSKMTFGRELQDQLKANVTRDDNWRDMLADGIYTRLNELAKGSSTFDIEDHGPILRFLMQLDFLPDEVATTFKAFESDPSQLSLLKGAVAGNERIRASMMVLQEQLKNGGIRNNHTQAALTDALGDNFDLLDVSLHGTAEGDFLLGHWSRVLQDQYHNVEVPTPLQETLLSRTHNGHVITGRVETGQTGELTNSLGDLAGRRAGTLTDTELDDAIDLIRQQSTRKLTNEEVYAAAAKLPAIREFAKRNKLSVDETTELLRTRRTTVDRKVDAEHLWGTERKNWTAKTVEQQLEGFGLELAVLPTGEFVFASTRGLALSTLKRQGLKGAGSKKYTTFREAMQDARSFLDGNPNYRKRHGPKARVDTARLKVDPDEIAGLRAILNDIPDAPQLFRTPTLFDEAVMPEALLKDFERISELRRRRDLPVSNTTSEKHIAIKTEKRLKEAAAPSTPDELRVMFHGAGVTIPEEQLTDVAVDYARGKFLMQELQEAHARAEKSGMPLDVSHLLPDIERHLVSASMKTKQLVLDALGPEYTELFEKAQELTSLSWKAAKESGTWLPGSPIGYVARFLTGEQQQRMQALIGDIHKEDAGLLMRLGVKQAQKHERRLDEFTLDDLNQLSIEIADIAKRQSSPELKALHKRLDGIMEEAGVGIKGFKNMRWAYTGKAFSDDPWLGIIQRLGNAQNDGTLTGYFDELFKLGTGKNGDSMMLGGKVIGVIDDTTMLDKIPSTSTGQVRTLLRDKEKGRVKSLGLREPEEVSPWSLVIETAEGEIKIVENSAISSTGFAFLKLGNVAKAEALGKRPSLGQSFSDAMLRSDVYESVREKPWQLRQEMEAMIDHNVIFGSSNMLRGVVKSAADIHRVVPAALRTFDNLNYVVKSWQTIFRLPFATANMSSGVFQASLAGVTPKNILLAYKDTVRGMRGNQDFARKSELLDDLVGSSVDLKSNGFVSFWKGDQSRLIKFAEAHSNPEFVNNWHKTHGTSFDTMEDLVLHFPGGREESLIDILRQAGEMQLFSTHAGSLARGSRTASEQILRTKLNASTGGVTASLKAGKVGEAAKKVPGRLGARARNLAEESEVTNRMMTVFGLVREGHTVRRAIEITKQAHVPYEKLTHFEKSWVKRFSVFYTFPRHYMPWAWTKFMEDPKKLARISHFIREEQLVDTAEGRPNLVIGDYRFDLGRLNANVEAAALIAGFLDRVAMPAGELLPGVDPNYTRKLNRSFSDAGLLNLGGIAAPFIGSNIFTEGARSEVRPSNTWEEAINMIWPIKAAMQVMGKIPGRDEYNPQLTYTPMEKLLSDPAYGVGLRKVKPAHEMQLVRSMYQKELRKLQNLMAGTKDPEKQERYGRHIESLSDAMMSAMESREKRVFK